MTKGNIVEYIEQQKIIAAAVLEENKGRLKLITENNREVSFSSKRLSHFSQVCLDVNLARDAMVNQLKALALKRKTLSEAIDIRQLWELLHEESGEIDLPTMTLFCFDPPLTADHEAAVIRAFFNDRLYFKFNQSLFSPFSPDQVESKKHQLRRMEAEETLVRQGSDWINQVLSEKNTVQAIPQVVDILKDAFLFGNDSSHKVMARRIIKRSQLNSPDQLFPVFVKAGIFSRDENIDLLSMQIPTVFSRTVLKTQENLTLSRPDFMSDPFRTDLSQVPMITIDGQSTLDFDDAISLETTETGYTLGIHIIDVDAYIKSEDPIDLAARERASSIYMPDDKLPMIPPGLSEDLCSLKKGETRPGISTLVKMNRFFEIQEYQILPSIIRVHEQMSYAEANLLNGKNDPVTTLYKIATTMRDKRLKAGAIQITLPEVNVWLEENNEIGYSKIDRENPSRMLVSEMMILANSLMAEFLAANEMPAVFRSQAAPRERLFSGIETSLTLNLKQRKHLSRAMVDTKPAIHSGLGVKAYATATSPIRRYHDLLTQRQIKAVLGCGTPYSREELDRILAVLALPLANAGRIQGARKRYWLIKYLETKRNQTFEALVMDKFRDHYQVLIKEFMLEARLPNTGLRLKYGDVIRVTIQHADARREQLSLFA